MKLFNGHVELTNKSVSTLLVAVIGVLIAFNWLTAEEATAVSAVIAAIASVIVPARAPNIDPEGT